MLQTRVGKRNGVAAIKMAVDMFKEGMIDKETAIMRVNPNQLDELPSCFRKKKAKTMPKY